MTTFSNISIRIPKGLYRILYLRALAAGKDSGKDSGKGSGKGKRVGLLGIPAQDVGPPEKVLGKVPRKGCLEREPRKASQIPFW